MLYSELIGTYEALNTTSKGLEKTSILADFLSKISGSPEYVYLVTSSVFPEYDARELGISHQLAIRAIARAAGVSDGSVVEEFKTLGELGLVAEKIFTTKSVQSTLFSKTLTVDKVFRNLRRIPSFVGKGTVDQKIGLVVELLGQASPLEAKYIVRSVLGDLKLGVGSGLLRDAIGEYVFKPQDIAEKKVVTQRIQEAYDKANDWSEVFSRAVEGSLEDIKLSPKHPVKVMLFPKASDIDDAFRIIGSPAAFEYKYDGFRVMVTKDKKGVIKLFTRRLEDVTAQFPEIVEYAQNNISAKTFMIDAEAVGYNAETKQYTPFQEISQRIRRKYGIQKMREELPVELVVFDIIFHEGKSLMEEPFGKRRKLLEKITREEPYSIVLANQIITGDSDQVQGFYDRALQDNQEGVMGKNLSAPYKPGARIGHAVKLKPEDKDFDLVITGAEWGTGKRAGWLTSFDVSCQDENSTLVEVGKVSTGLKELREEGLSFEELTEQLIALKTGEHGKKIVVQPRIVVTVQYQNIQKSTNYSSGYALRFPRIKALRPDRGSNDVATVEEIAREAE